MNNQPKKEMSGKAIGFTKPVVMDCGTVAALTAGLPKEILEETGGFYCIESSGRIRARD